LQRREKISLEKGSGAGLGKMLRAGVWRMEMMPKPSFGGLICRFND
jgi:hypothetical protein